jgi:hypothetical protein
VKFEYEILIQCEPASAFALLRDKHAFQQREGSPVLSLEKLTPGPVGVGTQFREVVQMLPCFRGEILSEVTRCDQFAHLEESFQGPYMRGYVAYTFSVGDGQTRLVQFERLQLIGWLQIFSWAVALMLKPRLRSRLRDIKLVLESG